MRWLWKVVLGLWVVAVILIGLHVFIDWDRLEHNRAQERIERLLATQNEVLRILVKGFELNAEIDFQSLPFLYRVYTNGELALWSDNKALPAYSLLRQQDSLYYLQHTTGKYVVQRKSVFKDGVLTEFFSVLQLQQDFQILNNYLRSIPNQKVFNRPPLLIDTVTEYPIDYKGKVLFGIVPSGRAETVLLATGIWMVLISFPFVVFFFLRWIQSRWPKHYLGLSILSLVMLRALMVLIGFPERWLEEDLFNATFYNSYFLDLTLGDVLFNMAFLVVIAVVILRQFGLHEAQTHSNVARVVGFITATLLVYLNVYFFHWSLSDMMANSQIEFDITKSIQFDFTRMAALLVVILCSAFYFLVNHLLVKWVAYLQVPGGLYLLVHLICLVLFIQLFPEEFPLFLFQFAWYWVAYLSDLSLRFTIVRKVSLEYILSIGAMLALIYAYVVYNYHEQTDLEAKQKFANKLVLEKDVLGEYYLNEIIVGFQADASFKERLNGGIFARQNIREKVRRQFVSSYFDKYELELLLFGKDSLKLDEEGPTYGYFLNKYARPEFRTDYPNIYLVNDTENITQRKYACFLPIGQEGFITISLNRKRNVLASVFPELLVESKFEQEKTNTYDYTIYRDSTVLYGQGSFGHTNYLIGADLTNPELYRRGISKDGNNFYGMRTSDGRTIVIVSPSYPNRNWVVNFSFVFLIYILVISVIGLVYRFVLSHRALTLGNKIQLYLAFGFFIPLFITGFALLNTLNTSYRDEITRSYLKKSLRISENLVLQTTDFVDGQIGLTAYANYVGDVSGFVQADLNVYSADGRLITTSQPGIFGLNLLSDRINPIALDALTHDNQNIILDESIGLLEYKTTYTTISGFSDGKLYGILALPFFDSKNHLKLQQREVFADLLMIFALIFLIALISGNYILNLLIGPLKLVSDHIKRTTLEDHNEPIDYTSTDEIGGLVKEYNQMLLKLERNKEALARSQKESAWKEIARQVAHEIKNPLTPMRLKIQQLQRDIQDERKYGVLESLLVQIDTLSHIADSFSEFAKMPAPINSYFDLREPLHQSVQLHQGKDVLISMDLPDEPVVVYADPNIVGRVFNNLILNAIQAVKDGQAEIDIELAIEGDQAIVSIQDNGSGIAADIQDKIFATYFSTKSTGSGIGLAVAKKGIENAGGHIWFETSEGEGTTFFISLPVYAQA